MRVPPGGIIIWSGSLASIPTGFVLCDGNNGTPDLRNLFVVGAGDTYAVDDTGGSLTHTHAFTSDGHQHSLPPGGILPVGGGWSGATTFAPDTGTTDPGDSLPPYYSLAYIMKT